MPHLNSLEACLNVQSPSCSRHISSIFWRILAHQYLEILQNAGKKIHHQILRSHRMWAFFSSKLLKGENSHV